MILLYNVTQYGTAFAMDLGRRGHSLRRKGLASHQTTEDEGDRRVYNGGYHKVLWKTCESKPDNYVDPHFLESLVVNADVPARRYLDVVRGALLVSNHICMVSVLVGVSYELHISSGRLSSKEVFVAEAGLFILGLVLHVLVKHGDENKTDDSVSLILTKSFILTVLACLLSPVYATLTTSISPDTTIACICGLLVAHLYLYDYTRANDPWKKPSLLGSLGIACGMCASVLMATRMKHLSDVVSMILLSLQLYIGSPYLQHSIFQAIPGGRYACSVLVVTVAITLVGQISVVATSWLLAILLLVVFLGPMWLVRIEKFKAHINGPWDEAVPHLAW